MKQSKVLAGLVVASVSTGAGVVHAEDAVVETQPKVTTSEVAKVPEVTESQVTEAKVSLDQASSEVKKQEGVVAEATTAKNQAQTSVVTETTKVREAEKVAKQSTPEAIIEATEAVTEAKQAVTAEETNLKDAQATETKANQDVQEQAKTVDENAKSVTTKQAEVTQAQETVNTARKAIDSTTANTNLAEAEKVVAEKTTEVKTAETNLETAKQADAKTAEQKVLAEKNVANKTQLATDTKTLLDQLVKEISNEKVTTSLSNQAYFNQRDSAWARYYGNSSFAATGCVPTSLAMVFTELAKRGITPTDVANYLYNNTNDFNKTFSGTSANGIVSATKGFGFVPTHLGSQSAIVDALQNGHHVVGAVQNNKFSPWGPGYSHEIVMRGFSNGNTYVYDPYNRANIGWYPVSNLWLERSGDKDDNALGVPFFKITTQKMAQLEAKKVQAQSAVNTAQSQLTQAKQILSSLQATAPKTPEAQRKLDTAKVELATAQDSYVKAQEAVHLASQDLAVKEATLKDAKTDLLTKQTALTDAQEILSESQAKLATLQSNLANAQAKVKEAQLALSNANTTVGQKEAHLLNLQNAPKVLVDSQTRLEQSKAELAKKVSILNQEIVKLKELQSKQADAEAQYTTVFEAYKAVLDAKKQAELMELYAKIIAGGGEAIPVIDETGKVTGYVDGTKKVEAKATAVVLSHNKVSTEVNEKKTEAMLPHAGEQSMSLLTVVGVSIISLLGLSNLKRKED
ncbi:LPXTG cell wall anchor domain-containing protein [Streptococcus iniae]|uniref:C39 family peptidase n=1 Tax=Streptococcus iniae TaxID=1346 RepID=UPI0003107234|nr:C39 family peptidase [Streptococcus iniae]ESR10537.1 gram positive anchor [Streptococcus iniae IUSA1]KYJ81221.1 cell wall anchor protein [Streptococcus iniae]RMI72628.1 LPXTG cell wall anchor domain-containing protein [Streptococcus iniae]HEK4517248.1 C39 family peptidase [Streptococcus iniae]